MFRSLFLALALFFLVSCNACVREPMAQTGRFVFHSPSTYFAVGQIHVNSVGVDPTDGSLQSFTKSGTAWGAFSVDGKTVLLTAGHVCPNHGETIGENRTIVSYKISFDDYYGKKHEAREIFDDEDAEVCALLIDYKMPTLSLADEEPSIGRAVTYVGFPQMNFSIVDGRWVGAIANGFVNVSLFSAPGASGSPVVDAGGKVVGMLVRYNAQYPGTSFLVSLKNMRSILKGVAPR